jgi:hypothetical protein
VDKKEKRDEKAARGSAKASCDDLPLLIAPADCSGFTLILLIQTLRVAKLSCFHVKFRELANRLHTMLEATRKQRSGGTASVAPPPSEKQRRRFL